MSVQVLTKYYPTSTFGVDRDGHPLVWNCTGNMDFKGVSYVYGVCVLGVVGTCTV